jgi:protein-disulfide isomerase
MMVSVFAGAQDDQKPEPAPKVMRFIKRALTWYPDSQFELVSNTRFLTPSGSYRIVEVARTCASRLLTGKPTMMVDENANTIWLGSVIQLPPIQEAGASTEALRTFLSQFLPEALSASMGLRIVGLEWDLGPRRPGALIPLDLMVESGYGKYRRRAAITADGKYLVMASGMPLDEDPVAYRRRLLADSDLVTWDMGSGNEAVEIVEFSDLECPACKGKWPIINMVLKKHQNEVRHGMVSFPLTSIHPWAFRAATASWCIAVQNPHALASFKETFYALQREMEISLVTPTAIDFIAGRGLDEGTFRECYLRAPSIDGVLRQLSLGYGLGLNATPTYFVNGWRIQVPDGSWFPAFVDRLAKGEEP